jgi:signal transduction histidine kinase
LGGLAGMMHRAEEARDANLHMAGELRAAQQELELYTTQVEELAREKARTALARELHDSVTQTVFSMNLAVETARLTLPRGPAPASAQLDRVLSLAQGALSEIGMLVSQLGPTGMQDESVDLPGRLRRLAVRYCAGGELEVVLCEPTGTARDLPPHATAGLCNIVQEALANVKKHAGTSQAWVRMELKAKPAWVEVEDHGCGFDLEAALLHPGHLGLAEMQERAREIGWKLSIDAQPGRGTRLRIQEAAGEEE